jgi:hypothetical protein
MDPLETLAVQMTRVEGKLDLQMLEVTHLRRALQDQKADVASLRDELATKADKTEFALLRGHITKGAWIVIGTVIAAVVGVVLKTHGA